GMEERRNGGKVEEERRKGGAKERRKRSGGKEEGRKGGRASPAGRRGPALSGLVLRGAQELAERERVDVAEHRGSRRQQQRVQELLVEVVPAVGRAVDDVAALVDADGLAAGVEADNRAAVVQCLPAPAFEKAQEVVR